MKHLLKNMISVCWSFVRFSLIKMFHPGRIVFCPVERISPNVIINISGKLVLGNRVRVHHGSKISAGGELVLGDNVAINQNCGIFSMERIEIGEGTELGPGVLIYDHDHDFRAPGGLKAGKFKTAPVVIGKNVWIGANSIVLRGGTIGDNCVVGAGTVVSGNVPANTILTQKRENIIREIIPETED